MDFLSPFFLLLLGFLIGISGAVMPGPLFVYTVNESLSKGKYTGALVILGHAIVEMVLFVLLALGLLAYASNAEVVKAVSVLGGIAMILMGIDSFSSIDKEVSEKMKKTRYGVVMGGIIFTALNPGFPIWWLTAGSGMLLEGYKSLGEIGMILTLVGHWGADLAWFLFVSMTTHKSRHLLKEGWYRNVRILLSLMLFGIGLYFLSRGI